MMTLVLLCYVFQVKVFAIFQTWISIAKIWIGDENLHISCVCSCGGIVVSCYDIWIWELIGTVSLKDFFVNFAFLVWIEWFLS